MGSSRTKNVSHNMIVALICQITNLIVSFIARTVFIKTLGAEYLGVNGLFSNILTILSFAELGIGNALLFSMYRPLANGETSKICSLMALYKRAYNIIATTITFAGFCVVPFLQFIIKQKPDIPENIYFLYILFLLNTILSYVFVYKKSIIIADQKNWIVLLTKQGGHITMTIAQIVILIYTHNFILFLILQFTFTLLENIVCSAIADRMYPYIKLKGQVLPKDETKAIFQNVKSMAFYKFGSVILNGTDNILVSAMVNISTVGIVSNYALFNSACNSILGNITSAFTASVGNLNAIGTQDQKYNVFKKILFLTAWLYGFCSMALIFLSKELIPVWLGSDYLLSTFVVISIVSEFYIQGIHTAESTYRITSGLFVKGRFAPLVGSIVNIILSIILYKIIGLAGIFFATPIARMTTIGIVDSLLVYKNVFHQNPMKYYITNILYLLIFIVLGIVSNYCSTHIYISGWFGFVVKTFVFSFVFNLLFVMMFYRTTMFQELLFSIRQIIKK